jgi:OPA family glycerol-3-phosphate transporter-like MFS transporter
MNWNPPILRPALHIPKVSGERAQQLYPKMRWQIMESTFVGYATFYFVRNNLPVVSREMGFALQYSKEQVGNILAATAIAYGIGKLFMGAWSDRSNPRYFMSLGLLITACCNFAFGAASSYPVHLALWALNGLAQSMGWAPCGRSLGHWYSVGERGTKFAFWNVAQNLGGGLTGLLVAYTTGLLGCRLHSMFLAFSQSFALCTSSSGSEILHSRSAYPQSRNGATTILPACTPMESRS